MTRCAVTMKHFVTPKSKRPPSEDEQSRRRQLKDDIANIQLYGVTSPEEIEKIKAKLLTRSNWSPGGAYSTRSMRR